MTTQFKKARSVTDIGLSIDLKASAQEQSIHELNDEGLMLAYAKGDAEAFNHLYERHRTSLYRYMRRQLMYSEAMLDELYQDVWLKIINSKLQYKVKASFKTYLYQIANNTIKDHFRRESVRKIMSNIEHDSEVVDKSLLPEDLVEKSNLILKFKALLNELPQQQRDVFLLREEAGLTSVQIADVMQVSVETVKSRMRYAVARLKSLLE